MKFMVCCLVTLLTLSCSTVANNSTIVEVSTNYGAIIIKLDKEKAPNTVKNFLSYVDEGFYDGTIFHRVIDGFMIQGADLTKKWKKTDQKTNHERKLQSIKQCRGNHCNGTNK